MVRQFWPVAALAVVVVAFFVFGPDNTRILQELRENRGALLDFVADHAVFAGVAYAVVYALAIALSVPGGAMMTIAGGFLFGWWLATVYVVFAAMFVFLVGGERNSPTVQLVAHAQHCREWKRGPRAAHQKSHLKCTPSGARDNLRTLQVAFFEIYARAVYTHVECAGGPNGGRALRCDRWAGRLGA